MQLNEAKNHLKKQGWTQAQAATHLNVTESYLCRVLNGGLRSARLLHAVMQLGKNPKPRKAPTYARAA